GADAVETALNPVAVDHDVEAVEGPQEPLGVADVDGDLLDLRFGQVTADLRRGDAGQAAVLGGDDQPALWGGRAGSPGTLVVLRHRVEQLDAEIFVDLNLVGRGGGRFLRRRLRRAGGVSPLSLHKRQRGQEGQQAGEGAAEHIGGPWEGSGWQGIRG